MTDESYIKLALEIAKKGKGKVSPNPLVGAVIVKNEKIIGAGYHEYFGGNHAEINAIKNANQPVEGAELYVTLEPCSHYGKTPPCADAIIDHKFKKVVIGTLDANPVVCGNGVTKLTQAGIEVKTGVLENECRELNKFFFKFITEKLPYITLKAAQTLDGKIADLSGESKWISSVSSRKFVHQLRSEYDAVLVGTSTVKADNPKLNVRLTEGRDPKKIITDSKLKLNLDLNLFVNNQKDVFIITSEKSKEKKRKIEKLQKLGAAIIFVEENWEGSLNLHQAFSILAEKEITSILVEGGSKIFTSLIKHDLYDEFLVFVTPKLLGSGIPVVNKLNSISIKDAVKLRLKNTEIIGEDILIELRKS